MKRQLSQSNVHIVYYTYSIILKGYTTSSNSWYTKQHFGNFCCYCSHNTKYYLLLYVSMFERMGLSHVCQDKHIKKPAKR